jgi:hypothetical protein
MNWSRGLFRAWVLGSTLWLLGWSAHLLLGWPSLPAETADCEAVKHKGPTELLTDNEMKCVAFLRLTDQWSQWSVIGQMRYGIDANQRIQDVHQLKGEDDCFVLTQSYIETFVENPALDIKPDRTLMLRYELKSLCQDYRTDALSHFFYAIHSENVRNHILTTTVAAFGIPAISFVLGWAALLWVGRGFKRD